MVKDISQLTRQEITTLAETDYAAVPKLREHSGAWSEAARLARHVQSKLESSLAQRLGTSDTTAVRSLLKQISGTDKSAATLAHSAEQRATTLSDTADEAERLKAAVDRLNGEATEAAQAHSADPDIAFQGYDGISDPQAGYQAYLSDVTEDLRSEVRMTSNAYEGQTRQHHDAPVTEFAGPDKWTGPMPDRMPRPLPGGDGPGADPYKGPIDGGSGGGYPGGDGSRPTGSTVGATSVSSHGEPQLQTGPAPVTTSPGPTAPATVPSGGTPPGPGPLPVPGPGTVPGTTTPLNPNRPVTPPATTRPTPPPSGTGPRPTPGLPSGGTRPGVPGGTPPTGSRPVTGMSPGQRPGGTVPGSPPTSGGRPGPSAPGGTRPGTTIPNGPGTSGGRPGPATAGGTRPGPTVPSGTGPTSGARPATGVPNTPVTRPGLGSTGNPTGTTSATGAPRPGTGPAPTNPASGNRPGAANPPPGSKAARSLLPSQRGGVTGGAAPGGEAARPGATRPPAPGGFASNRPTVPPVIGGRSAAKPAPAQPQFARGSITGPRTGRVAVRSGGRPATVSTAAAGKVIGRRTGPGPKSKQTPDQAELRLRAETRRRFLNDIDQRKALATKDNELLRGLESTVVPGVITASRGPGRVRRGQIGRVFGPGGWEE